MAGNVTRVRQYFVCVCVCAVIFFLFLFFGSFHTTPSFSHDPSCRTSWGYFVSASTGNYCCTNKIMNFKFQTVARSLWNWFHFPCRFVHSVILLCMDAWVGTECRCPLHKYSCPPLKWLHIEWHHTIYVFHFPIRTRIHIETLIQLILNRMFIYRYSKVLPTHKSVVKRAISPRTWIHVFADFSNAIELCFVCVHFSTSEK